jgi:hypothetical protein
MNCSLPASWEIFFASSALAIVALPGFIVYVLILFAISRNWSSYENNSYYKLLISHGICDVTILIIFAFYSVPCTLLQCHIFGDEFDKILGFILIVSWYTTLACISLIAVNRYWAVCKFVSYKTVFSNRNSVIYVSAVWIFGTFFAMWQLLPCCGEVYYYDSYAWSYDTAPWNKQWLLGWTRVKRPL